MHVLIDNTGLHSAGRCLEGRGIGAVDLKGLLQLATEIVFCKRILVSGFESEGVRGRSEAIREKLEGLGLGKGVMDIRPYDRSFYAAACEEAGARFLRDFETALPQLLATRRFSLQAARPDLLPRELKIERDLHTLVSKEWTDKQLDELAEASLAEKAVGSMAYTVIRCRSLWEKVNRAAKAEGWTSDTTDNLIVALRYYINTSLAEKEGALYTLAVARAQMLRRNTAWLVSALSKMVEDAARGLAPWSVGAPSVADAMVRRCGGDPQGLIREAVSLRELGSGLREYLVEALERYEPGSVGWQHELHNRVRELSWALDRELQPHNAPKFTDALQVQVTPPFISADVKLLRDWYKFRRMRSYLVLLTELSKWAAYGEREEWALSIFKKKSCVKGNSRKRRRKE